MDQSELKSVSSPACELIHDRGRGPEIVGTRTTVYNLLPYFLDAGDTESSIAALYDLTHEQVAAARAYVLNNAEAVLKRHAEIEARMAAGNPPDVVEKLKRDHGRFLQFKEYAARRAEARDREAAAERPRAAPVAFPTFQEWLAQRSSQMSEQA